MYIPQVSAYAQALNTIVGKHTREIRLLQWFKNGIEHVRTKIRIALINSRIKRINKKGR
jgi:hypothetical protein